MKLYKKAMSGSVVDTSKSIGKGARVLAGLLVATVIIYSGFLYIQKEDALLPEDTYGVSQSEEDMDPNMGKKDLKKVPSVRRKVLNSNRKL